MYKYKVETDIMVSAGLNILREGFSHFLFYDLIVCVKSLKRQKKLKFILLKILLLHVQEKKYLKIAEKVYFLAESQYFLCKKVHIKLQKCKAPDK